MPLWLVGVAAKIVGFGKRIPVKEGLILAAVLVVLILLWWAVGVSHKQLQHVRDVEASNAQLLKANKEWSQSYAQVVATNQSNERALISERQATTKVREIANSEITLANNRATHYRDIRDAALRSKPSNCPVDPVVLDTVGRLWDTAPVSPAAADSRPK